MEQYNLYNPNYLDRHCQSLIKYSKYKTVYETYWQNSPTINDFISSIRCDNRINNTEEVGILLRRDIQYIEEAMGTSAVVIECTVGLIIINNNLSSIIPIKSQTNTCKISVKKTKDFNVNTFNYHSKVEGRVTIRFAECLGTLNGFHAIYIYDDNIIFLQE